MNDLEYPVSELINDKNMEIIWDHPIEMPDGVTLRCDIFKPIEGESFN